MTLHTFSRRRLLGGLLAGLAAWLCPRSTRSATPCRIEPVASPRPNSAVAYYVYSFDYNPHIAAGELGSVTTYVYNCKGRPPCV